MLFKKKDTLPQDPVFIVGYPRSGTTLLQRLLMTQPGVDSLPETHYFCVIEKKIEFGRKGRILPASLNLVWESLYDKMEFRFSDEDIKKITRLSVRKKLTSKDLFEFIVFEFMRRSRKTEGEETSYRWIEKTPVHYNYIDRIIEFYPRAQILHIVRHPVPAVFSRKLKFPFNKETPLETLAERWGRMVKVIESFCLRFPDRIHTLRYEDLLSDMREELEKIAGFLKFDLDRSLIADFSRTAQSIILPSEAWKLDEPEEGFVNTNDVYKGVIARKDARAVEAIVEREMRIYGYRPYFDDVEQVPG
ncbi:MAG: sulfotransferase [Candidatus Aminicenantes bacterium]|nr:sulfotransferase [Candidatus Aminicenantes bacterium]